MIRAIHISKVTSDIEPVFVQSANRRDISSGGLLCLHDCMKWVKLNIQRTKDCVRGKGMDGVFKQIKTLYFPVSDSAMKFSG